MPSVMAIVSKPVFEALPHRSVGDVVSLDRYTSKNPAFTRLEPGDAIFLVTVRPGDQLLLVAVLDDVRRKGGALVGAVNTTPITEIVVADLPPIDRKKLTAKRGKLAMSLQTPRHLTIEAAVWLRGGATSKRGARTNAVPREAALRGGKLGPRAKQLVADIYRAPRDRALRGVLADQLLEDHHVWGELISLQLNDAAKHRDRVQEIIREHARTFVGAIAHVADPEDLEFEAGFPVAVRCGKAAPFAEQRRAAARAPEWATVETVTFTYEVPGAFIEALFQNPALANLTTVASERDRRRVALTRDASGAPWQIATSPHAERVLDALPSAELARIPMPASPAARATLEAARAKRAPRSRKQSTLWAQLGLPKDWAATRLNTHFSRDNAWSANTQKEVDRLDELSHASQCWLAAGLITAVAARLELLAPRCIPTAIEVRDQLLELQQATTSSTLPTFGPVLSEDVADDAELAVTRAINLGRQIGHAIATRSDLGNVPYRLEGLRTGVLWLLWGQQAVHVYSPWYKRALRVATANDKRTSPERRFGHAIPARMLDLNVPATRENFEITSSTRPTS